MADATSEVRLTRFVPGEDDDALVAFLTGNHWPFHVHQDPDADAVRALLADGSYDGTKDRTFWVGVAGERAGMVRATDIGNEDPQVDIRLAERWRGRGVGRLAVAALVAEVFAEFGDIDRIEASARRDNVASRRTLRACGFVKEAVYRRAYEPYVTAEVRGDGTHADGGWLDSIGYALLRRDWESGTSTPVDWDEEP